MSKSKRKSPLYLGKETYGTAPIEEVFRKALEPYFNGDNIIRRTIDKPAKETAAS